MLLVDYREECPLNLDEDGVFVTVGRLMHCNAWVFWIAINAVFHFFWVGSLLGYQLYQVIA